MYNFMYGLLIAFSILSVVLRVIEMRMTDKIRKERDAQVKKIFEDIEKYKCKPGNGSGIDADKI